jgi:hypothetical protein
LRGRGKPTLALGEEGPYHRTFGSRSHIQAPVIHFFSKLEDDIRENMMDIISQIKTATAVLPTESEQKNGELDGEFMAPFGKPSKADSLLL